MSKLLTGQTNFTAGVLSPRMFSRIDYKAYANGLKEAVNFRVVPHGPIVRRNGSQFIAYAKSTVSTGNSRGIKLLRFQFSTDDAYVMEFGEPAGGSPYIRLYRDGGQVLKASKAITGVTQASPAVVTTSTAHGLVTGDNVYITDILGMTELNRPNKPYQVGTVGSSTTFQVLEIGGDVIDSTGFTAWSSGGIVEPIFEIESPYDFDDIDELSYVQFGNSIYFAHSLYPPKVLTRVSSLDWTFENIKFSPEPTYESGYEPATTLTPAAISGSAVNFTAGTSTFLQGDVGRQIINNADGETGKAIITSITSATVAVANIIESFTDTSAIASGDWKLDLSPIAKLKFSGYEAGSIVTVRAQYTEDYRGPKKDISGITNSSTAVISSTSHGFSNGDKVEVLDVEGMREINNRNFFIYSVAANSFGIRLGDGTGTNMNTANFNTYTSGGTVARIYENINQDTFRSADVGKYIIANDGVLKILSVTNAYTVECECLKGLTSTDSTENWTLEDLDWTEDRGYPRCVGLYQERLVFASTTENPVTVYMSETGIFEGFGRGSGDSDAIIVDISSAQVNQINWIANSRDLVLGSSGAEITISAPSASSGLSSSNIDIKTRTYYGSNIQNPITVGYEILFNQGRKVRTFRYDFNLDGYTGDDLSFLAEHLTTDGIKEIAYSQEPDNVVYAVTNGGELIVTTYLRNEQIIGTTKYTTDGYYENVQIISNGNVDEIWVVVRREINGLTYRYIELFDDGTGDLRIDGFSDSYLVYSLPITATAITKANPAVVTAAAHGLSNGDRVKVIDVEGMTEIENIQFLVANKTTNTFELTDLQGNNINSTSYSTFTAGNVHKLVNEITGLDHLNGETVQVKVDGAAHTDEVVTNGAIDLNDYHYEVTVGLPYTSSLVTLQKDLDLPMGPAQGQRQRYIRPLLRVYSSTLPSVDGNMTPSRKPSYNMNAAVPLYSGDIEYGMLNWSNAGSITVTVTDPLPLNLSGIFGTFEATLK